MQIAPAPILSSIVKHFLILENDQPALLHHRFSPDGHAGMVFYYRELFTQQALVHPRSFVYGQASQFHDLTSAGRIGMLIVVLQPHALHALTQHPAHLLTNRLVPAPDIFGPAAQELEEKILLAAGNHSRVLLMEQFLTSRIYNAPAADRIAGAAVSLVYRYQGLAPVSQLAQELGITERHLERRFHENIGLSPKQFLRTIRFQYLLKLLQEGTADNLTQTAYHAGYYDQSHFIREFRMLAGISPKQYRAHPRLAINFMQLGS